MHQILKTAAIAAIALTLPASAFAHDEAGAAPAAPAATPPAAAATSEPEWFADFDKAVEAAKAQKKDLLVDFTGSDWCGWCIRLHDEVFSKDEFKAAAPKDFILVALDFPNGEAAKAKVPNPQRNQELAQKYEIRGFPSILVLDADGTVVAQTGYMPGGPKPYVENLSKIRAAGRAAIAALPGLEAELAAAAPADKGAVIEKALKLLEPMSGGPTARVAKIVRASAEADPENKSGLRLRAVKALFATGDASEAEFDVAALLDPKNEHGLLEQCLAAKLGGVMQSGEGFEAYVAEAVSLAKTGNLKDENVYVGALANAVGMAMQFGMEEQGREIAKVLKEKGPKGNAQLDKFLEEVLSAKKADGADHGGHDHGDGADHDHGGEKK